MNKKDAILMMINGCNMTNISYGESEYVTFHSDGKFRSNCDDLIYICEEDNEGWLVWKPRVAKKKITFYECIKDAPGNLSSDEKTELSWVNRDDYADVRYTGNTKEVEV